jgi:hypothetical protein
MRWISVATVAGSLPVFLAWSTRDGLSQSATPTEERESVSSTSGVDSSMLPEAEP